MASPMAWPKRSLIDLKWYEVEGEDADRCLAPLRGFRQRAGSLEESTAIQQRGERIGHCGHLVEAHRPILCQRQDDEIGTHDIKHDFDREHGDPAAGGISRSRKGGERHRHEKDCPMQDGDEHRRPAPNERLAAFAPQFAGGRERIAGDDERTHQDA
jgi:hypothetical protein